jgi:NDP-sugar pyrophosphorylase family protein
MNGDVLTTLDFRKLFDYAVNSDTDLTVVTKEMITPFNFGKVISDGPYILEIEEKPDLRLEILAGIYVLKPAVLAFVPDGEYFGIDALIKTMLAQHRKVGRHLMREYWIDIGRPHQYEQAQAEYGEHFDHLRKATGQS